MVTVGFCCCGCSLRIGTLILLWLETVYFAIMLLISLSVSLIAVVVPIPLIAVVPLIAVLLHGVPLCICILGLYGVYAERPAFLIPFIVCNGILWVVLIILIILGVIITHFVVNGFLEYVRNNLPPGTIPATYVNVGLSTVVLIEIFLLIVVVIQTHFFLVVYSHYKELKRKPPDVILST